MQKILLSMLMLSYAVLASVVVPDEYLISDDEKVSYLYTQEHSELMPMTKAYQEGVMETYENEFGFVLDDELLVGIASSKNQIANAYSTQIPFNSQVLYGAGATYIDYFSIVSWLKTLLIHETAHNYQLNPKENHLSKISHHIVGNQAVSFLGFFPFFPIPNVLESSFNLEGNAVLNESRFGNGGRLFSGYAMAQVVTMAKAGKITPELMYNPTFEFPYSEKFYLIGGFFHQFLAQKYGVKKVNNYFKAFSEQPFPLFTNRVFTKHYGKSFEALLAEFVTEVNEQYQGFTPTKGKVLATTQVSMPFNRDEDEVYALIGDKKSANTLFRMNRKSQKVSFLEGSWRTGEVFKIDGQYYTQSSAKTSPVLVEMGVFDRDGYIKKGSEGKALQGYLANGKEVYFDLAKSMESPQVYVGEDFYTQSHSSVHVDKNNVYYFKQEGKQRTLYKNREAITSYEGYYGFVTDVGADGSIYFVATSQYGSTVYKVKDKHVKRVTLGDDVIDFKLVNEHEALVSTIGAEGYTYQLVHVQGHEAIVTPLLKTPEEEPFSFEKGHLEHLANHFPSEIYHPLGELKYSVLNQALYYGEESGVGINLQAKFTDPLLQNALGVVLSHDSQRDIAGLTYHNEAKQLHFGGSFYGVNKKEPSVLKDKRDVGYSAYLNLPFLTTGYLQGSGMLSYTRDYSNIYREPLTLSLDFAKAQKFGVSKYHNRLHALSLFGTSDRDSHYYGGHYGFQNDLKWQLYVGANITYMKSNMVDAFHEKGIELRDTFTALQNDKATLYVPSFSTTTYAQELKKAEVSLAKVFDFSWYAFSFPLSLQRESLYAKQRLYDIDFRQNVQRNYYESIVGTEFDLLLFHKLELPLSIEWVYNKDVVDTNKVNVYFGAEF
jgi:hypothetical protein